MSLLVLNNVTKTFGGLVAVDDVSFEIARGEMVAIVGPNGAGKTTLFNTISGVFLPDRGEIAFDDVRIERLPPYRRAHLGMGRTFQIPRPFGRMSVRENVAIGAMFGSMAAEMNVDRSMQMADHYIDRLGLHALRSKEARLLTPSENKRMGIARALAMKPKLLLLDESMAGMNPREIDDMIHLLRTLRDEEDIAIMAMVEHIMRAVVGLAQRVIVMHQGSIFLDAPAEQALSDEGVIDIYLGKSA